MKCGSKFGPVPENQGAVGRAGWLASFLDLPGAKFFCGKPPTHENSLNFANTCLKLVDTRRATPHKEKVNGVTFDVFDVGGVAAGHWLAADAYRSFHQNRCYELDFRVASVNIANFDPGTVKEFDSEAVNRSIRSVLDTFTFLK